MSRYLIIYEDENGKVCDDILEKDQFVIISKKDAKFVDIFENKTLITIERLQD